ncbi:hypothetical protein [Kitasatospora sp. NBC_01302]|uniref:hypothetical protein n=1 Tax=Kitasatospora sp. NBC_01302 TaxID=2903575 RepID=UPI002E12A402|nr:hypothetical protein OG294_13860 [Kitasatospora sp. NBC_01302]
MPKQPTPLEQYIRAIYSPTTATTLLDAYRDQVLTEAAESTRQAAEALPDGHKAIPGLLVATSGLLATPTDARWPAAPPHSEEHTTVADLPHDPYITVIDKALTAAGIGCDDGWTSEADEYDDEGVGTLSAVLAWGGTNEAVNAALLPYGLGVYWALTTGWQWAERHVDGSNDIPQYLPLSLWAEPADVVAAVRAVLACEEPPAQPDREWQNPDVAAAVAAWAAE